MEYWHLIDEDEYHAGPYASREEALRALLALCKDERHRAALVEMAPGFWSYWPPRHELAEHPQEFFVCTYQAALDR